MNFQNISGFTNRLNKRRMIPIFMSLDKKYNTMPATEENLKLESDYSPFDNENRVLSEPHAVLVDGIIGKACVGSLGTYSTRISITLEEEHPELGKEFITKYFIFKEPGLVSWGHEEKIFRIEKIEN